jgi:hypothetical protein
MLLWAPIGARTIIIIRMAAVNVRSAQPVLIILRE